jgi:mono/diheme cytochrome c family protein
VYQRAFTLLAVLSLPGVFAVAQSQSGFYTQKNLGNVSQSTPSRQREGALYAVEPYPLYTPKLAPGSGRELVEGYCHTCHSLRYITMQPPLPAKTWQAVVRKMIEVYGMQAPKPDVPQMVRYLQSHYSPGTRKH